MIDTLAIGSSLGFVLGVAVLVVVVREAPGVKALGAFLW